MSLRDALHQLTARSLAHPGPTWSVFLDITPARQEEALLFLQAHARALLPKLAQQGAQGAALRQSLLRGLSQVPQAVLKAQEAGHYGLALFCASGWGPTTLSIPLALPNRASLRQQVALEPILGPLEALEALTCVWITPREARLYDLAEGQPRLLERARATLRGDLTAEATAALLRWGRQRPSRVLVFLGEPAQTHALLRSLGEPGRQQTLALLPPQQVPADPGFLSWLLEALQEEHRLPPRAWPQEALHRLQVGAAGVLVGAPQVWRALAQGPGTLQAVLLGEEAPIEGWRCEGCQAWGPAPVPPACLSCGAAVDRGCVRAALARRAQEVGAPVTWLEPGHALLGWGSALALAAVEQPAHADQEQARQRR